MQYWSTRCAVFEAILRAIQCSSTGFALEIASIGFISVPRERFTEPGSRKTIGTYWTFTRDTFPVKSSVPRIPRDAPKASFRLQDVLGRVPVVKLHVPVVKLLPRDTPSLF